MLRLIPHRFSFFLILTLTLTGLGNSIYLAIAHYRNFTDLAFSSFCAISKAINCDTVAQSPWSIFLGIPLAIWGFLGYALLLVLIFPLRKNSSQMISLWGFIFLLSLCYSGVAIYLGYISATQINSYCMLCLANYLINFMILIGSWLICRRVFKHSFRQHFINALKLINNSLTLKIPLLFIFFTAYCLVLFLPKYWYYKPLSQAFSLPTGVTETGNPWIGAKNPVLIIEEYVDYQCFQCSKMHSFLRNLIAANPQKIRLIHHHYPMEHEFNPFVVPEPFHVGSGKMAMLAIYAQSQGKFWEANDIFFQQGREKKSFNTQLIASKLDLLDSDFSQIVNHPQIRTVLNRDILRGMKLRIMATPAFVIEGKVYTGFIPPAILEPYVRK